MITTIQENDLMLRQAFSPRDVMPGGIGVLNLASSFAFPSERGKKESVDCKRLIEDFPNEIHQRGYAKAQSDAERKAKNDIKYEGIIIMLASKILSFRQVNHFFEIIHEPENDNDAHCHIYLKASGDYERSKVTLLKKNLCDWIAGLNLERPAG